MDNNPKFEPDVCCDVLQLDVKTIPFGVDLVWASPPCTCFSVASIGSSWCGKYHPKRTETALSMAYVLKTFDIIRQVNPTFWFIENPRGVLRKMGFMEGFMRHTVTYCQYGDTRMKPTDIWTSCDITFKPPCKNGSSCHTAAPRGSRTGTQGLRGSVERGKVPKQLCVDIIKYCEDNI